MKTELQRWLLGTLFLSAGSAQALVDSGAFGTPGELFVSVYDAAGQKSFYKDLGINVDDFLKKPTASFDLAQEAAFTDFKGQTGLIFNIGASYPLAEDLSNIESWGYLATSSVGADIFDSGFNSIDASKQIFEVYIGMLNPRQFTGSNSEIAENLSGEFKPGDPAYFDEGNWGAMMGGLVGGDTTGKQGQPLPFFHVNNQTGDENGQVNRLGYWVLSPAGKLNFTAGSGNLPPIADAGPDRIVGQGASATLNGSASADPDNGPAPLTYAWAKINGPDVVIGSTDTSTANFKADKPGIYTFKLTVSDGMAQAEDTVQITVSDAAQNQSPLAHAGDDQAVPLGSQVTLDASASNDPDTAPLPLSYVWSQISGPSVNLSSAVVANPGFTALQEGTYVFQLTVSDGVASSVDAVTITVVAAIGNKPPVADAGSDQTVVQSTPVILNGSASSDPDNQPAALTYTWRQTSGSAVTLTDGDTSAPGFTPDKTGTYTFELTVSDGAATAKDTVSITVRQLIANIAPTANAGADQTLLLGVSNKTRLDATGSFDADSNPNPLRYAWSQETGPSLPLNDPAAATPELTVSEPGEYRFRLTVSDGEASASDTVTLYAEPGTTLKPALASAGTDQSVSMGTPVTLDGGKTSGSGPITYLWSQIDGPFELALSGRDTAKAGVTLPKPGHYVFNLVASNAAGRSEDTVELTALPTGASVSLSSPPMWQAKKPQKMTWNLYDIREGREAHVFFAKDGNKFNLIGRVKAGKQKMTWKPKNKDVTNQGVIRICIKPTQKKPQVCDSVGIIVQP